MLLVALKLNEATHLERKSADSVGRWGRSRAIEIASQSMLLAKERTYYRRLLILVATVSAPFSSPWSFSSCLMI